MEAYVLGARLDSLGSMQNYTTPGFTGIEGEWVSFFFRTVPRTVKPHLGKHAKKKLRHRLSQMVLKLRQHLVLMVWKPIFLRLTQECMVR